ncbi:MAG: hypothetical protein GX811_04490, partial [Lentisphaerae bacterium]|nr:hypothetical protein [Lentisphaerota bacterium]
RVKTFDEYDFTLQNGVTTDQMKRLCEFLWLEQAFNVLFLGAPAVGNYVKKVVMRSLEPEIIPEEA